MDKSFMGGDLDGGTGRKPPTCVHDMARRGGGAIVNQFVDLQRGPVLQPSMAWPRSASNGPSMQSAHQPIGMGNPAYAIVLGRYRHGREPRSGRRDDRRHCQDRQGDGAEAHGAAGRTWSRRLPAPASDQAAWVTSQTLNVDGGQVFWAMTDPGGRSASSA